MISLYAVDDLKTILPLKLSSWYWSVASASTGDNEFWPINLEASGITYIPEPQW